MTGSVNRGMLGGKLTDFVTYISKYEFWSAEIQQVDGAQDGNIKIVPTFGDHIIEFGNIENYDRKLKKLKTFYVNGLNKIGWGDYKTVNVEYDKQVVCTKEE